MFVNHFQKVVNVVETTDYCSADANLDRRALKVMEETVVDWQRFRMANSRLVARSV